MDRRAWQATVYGVAKSWTQLKQLSTFIFGCNRFSAFWLRSSVFLAVLGPCCCVQDFLSCSKQGPLFPVVCGPLTAVTSLAAEHGL